MQIQNFPVSEIRPYQKNAKKHPVSQIQGLKQSITKFGFKQPILIDKDKIIIAGHGRYQAALELNLKEVPCIVENGLNDDQIRAYRIIDNKLAETGWENDILFQELEDLQFDFEQFNLDFSDIKLPDDAADPASQDGKEDTTQYLIVIDCKSENAQRALYEEFEERGIACKLMM